MMSRHLSEKAERIEGKCLVRIALLEVLVPFGAILTCLSEVLTAHGLLVLSVGPQAIAFGGMDIEAQDMNVGLVGPFEIVRRICEVLIRLAGLLPCRAEVMTGLVEFGSGTEATEAKLSIGQSENSPQGQ
jgi:hypothetical protein